LTEIEAEINALYEEWNTLEAQRLSMIETCPEFVETTSVVT